MVEMLDRMHAALSVQKIEGRLKPKLIAEEVLDASTMAGGICFLLFPLSAR